MEITAIRVKKRKRFRFGLKNDLSSVNDRAFREYKQLINNKNFIKK